MLNLQGLKFLLFPFFRVFSFFYCKYIVSQLMYFVKCYLDWNTYFNADWNVSSSVIFICSTKNVLNDALELLIFLILSNLIIIAFVITFYLSFPFVNYSITQSNKISSKILHKYYCRILWKLPVDRMMYFML